MVGLRFNKFRGDKFRVMLALVLREMLQAQEETMQLDRERWLNVITVKVKGIWLDSVLIQREEGCTITITHNAAFQTDDLDAYDSDCDDISSAKAVLMANLSSCDSDVLSEVPYTKTYQNDLINEAVQEMQYSKHPPIYDSPDNEITSDSNIIPYS
ncbi:hypothetical protein Tco_0657499 [Tanacetum coccineum]|uniref:Uncharacterized protein n=1 Tax=Tanacetum coccineum TaxID=301880 RepID=A0ABQ4XBR0_9ASTR